jgi:hypothetical protein
MDTVEITASSCMSPFGSILSLPGEAQDFNAILNRGLSPSFDFLQTPEASEANVVII